MNNRSFVNLINMGLRFFLLLPVMVVFIVATVFVAPIALCSYLGKLMGLIQKRPIIDKQPITMKSTKFLAVILTLMAVTSCSDKSEMSGIPLQRGDATIGFEVGGMSVSTYATEAEETSISKLEVFLAYKNGRNVDTLRKFQPSDITVDGTIGAGFQIELMGSEYTPGDAILYMIANGSEVSAKTKAEIEGATQSGAIYTMTADGRLKLTGDRMAAARQVSIKLQRGPVTEAVYKDDEGKDVTVRADQPSDKLRIPLRRLAVRAYVTTPGGIDAGKIKDYTVSFNNTELNGAAGYFTYAGSSKGTLAAVNSYVIGSQNADNQYGKTEAVGYLYPSTEEVVLTIKSPHGLERTVRFAPKANYNYRVTITPVGDVGLDFSVSIQAYTPADEELGTDFQ